MSIFKVFQPFLALHLRARQISPTSYAILARVGVVLWLPRAVNRVLSFVASWDPFGRLRGLQFLLMLDSAGWDRRGPSSFVGPSFRAEN